MKTLRSIRWALTYIIFMVLYWLREEPTECDHDYVSNGCRFRGSNMFTDHRCTRCGHRITTRRRTAP